MRSTTFAVLLVLLGATLMPLPGTSANPSTTSLAIERHEYDFGSMLVSDPSILLYYSADLHGSVTYPSTGQGNGPYPVVLFMHGRHGTCSFFGAEAFGACPDYSPGVEPVNSFEGYDYLSDQLAAQGFVVISVDVNDINDRDLLGDSGAHARAQVALRTLDEFEDLNAAACVCSIGADLVGRQDYDLVGLMGHSRGGEGVTRAISVNQQRADPHELVAIFALAPTDFASWTAPNVAHATLLPYCDGDVSDLQGAHMYDDSRYISESTPRAKHQFLVMGTNHNFYNTIWTADDSGYASNTGDDAYCGAAGGDNGFGTGRLTAAEQRGTGLILINGFFRYYLAGDATYLDVLTGEAGLPVTGELHTAYHAPAGSRLVIEDTLNSATLTGNDLGGSSSFTGFATANTCDPDDCPSQYNTASAHQLTLAWDGSGATYATSFGSQDATGFDVVSFRVAVNHEDTRNSAAGQDLTVVLHDAHGASATVTASTHTDNLFTPPGEDPAKVVLNTVLLPTAAFVGVDLGAVTGVDLVFDQTSTGSVQVTDLMFQALP